MNFHNMVHVLIRICIGCASQVGVQYSTWRTSSTSLSFATCVWMMILDSLVYGALAWYLDKVLPSEHGTTMPPLFLFAPSYWERWTSPSCCSNGCTNEGLGNEEDLVERIERGVEGGCNPTFALSEVAGNQGDPEKFERGRRAASPTDGGTSGPDVGEGRVGPMAPRVGVSIRGLRREFVSRATGAVAVAVHGLYLDMYDSEVTVLLGHNGAGECD